eukprot:6206107-Pleurochrysis_carterae.AAC.2
MSLRSSAYGINLQRAGGRQHSHHTKASQSGLGMLAPRLSEVRRTMRNKSVIAHVDASSCSLLLDNARASNAACADDQPCR